MDTERAVSRRTVLTGAGLAAGALVVTACGGGSGGAQAARSAGGTGGSPAGGTGGSPAGGTGGSPAGGTGGSGTGAGGASGGTPLVKLADIPVGEAVAAKEPDGAPILVARPSADQAVAFSAICTHMGCTVNPAGKQLHCPCHGSVYDATTGKVIHGPAPRPLPPVPVHVSDGEVVTGA